MSWLRQLYYRLPPVARRWARRVVYLPLDALDLALGRNQGYPPRGKIFTGLSHFRSTGDRFLGYFVTYGQLKPEGQVLDIGSGIGRMAIPLSRYLSTKGRYEGFDIVAAGIHWCRKHLSSRYPHFTFTLVNLENDLYTSQGAAADSFVFPYPNDQFDLAILTSVFTHMLPREVENYLSEISRTLTPGGRCLATFFIVNQEVTDYMAANPQCFQFPYHRGHYRLLDEKVKAANVAYEEAYLKQLLAERDLKVVEWLHGFWSGRPKSSSLEFQDLLVVEKLKPDSPTT